MQPAVLRAEMLFSCYGGEVKQWSTISPRTATSEVPPRAACPSCSDSSSYGIGVSPCCGHSPVPLSDLMPTLQAMSWIAIVTG